MVYREGDKIGKYIVTRDFSTLNAGRCEWGFANYNQQEYFVKRFLSPVYPGEDAPGSEKNKQEKRKRCQAFEAKHQAIKNALSHLGEGGLIIQPLDFFKYGVNPKQGEHYFKVFHKVDTNSIGEDIHNLPEKERLSIMISATYTVSQLHSNNIIHFDLKPDNILVERSWGTVAKLIDFDDSIIVGEVINHEEIVGDFIYYSPELAKYIETGGTTPVPDFKSDIFALGLIFRQYWTGEFPNFHSDFDYAYQAVLNGEQLVFKQSRIKLSKSFKTSMSLSPEDQLMCLIEQMLLLSPEKRPTSLEVHNWLKRILEKM